MAKKKTGRPPKYKPEYCEQIIKLGREGTQTTGLAVSLGVTKTCLQQWCVDYAEFSVAFQKARAECEQYYLNLAKNRAPVSDNMLKFLLTACHGYREKTDILQHVTADVNAKVLVSSWGDDGDQ